MISAGTQEVIRLIKIKEAVIVEGKYDKIKLSNFIDGLIITTEGFVTEQALL